MFQTTKSCVMNLTVSDFYLANNIADIFPKVSFKQCAIDRQF